jgi:hypothetical protein
VADVNLDDEDTDKAMSGNLALQLLAETRRDVKALLTGQARFDERLESLEKANAAAIPGGNLKRDAGLVGGVGALVIAITQILQAFGVGVAPVAPAPAPHYAPAPPAATAPVVPAP